MILTLPNSCIYFWSMFGLKWRISIKQSIHDNANSPDINFEIVADSLKYFGGNIIRSSTNSPFIFLQKLKLRSKPKISNLYLKLIIEEHIPKFQIPMDIFFIMQVFDTVAYSIKKRLDLRVCEGFPLFQ